MKGNSLLSMAYNKWTMLIDYYLHIHVYASSFEDSFKKKYIQEYINDWNVIGKLFAFQS